MESQCLEVKTKIWKRKKLFYSKYKQSDVNWWKEVNIVCKPQAKLTQPSINSLGDTFYSGLDGIKQPNIKMFINSSCNSAPAIFNYT